MAAKKGGSRVERVADDIVEKVFPPTKVQGASENDKKKLSQQSYYDVYEVDLNRGDGAPPLIISGNDVMIAMQISLLKAISQMLPEAGGSSNDRAGDIKMLTGHPKVTLHFWSKLEDGKNQNEERNDRKKAEVSFRLMDKKDTDLSISECKALATKIKTAFMPGNKPYAWSKGKVYYAYNHWENGYAMKILASGTGEAEKLIRTILSIQSHQFIDTNMTISANKNAAKAYPSQRQQVRIFGEQKKGPERRPKVTVYFRYATLELSNYNENMVLCSVDGRHPVDGRIR